MTQFWLELNQIISLKVLHCKLPESTGQEPNSNGKVRCRKSLLTQSATGKIHMAQISAMQIIQTQSGNPKTMSVFQQTNITRIIQNINQVTGKRSITGGSPNKMSKQKENPNSEILKQSQIRV